MSKTLPASRATALYGELRMAGPHVFCWSIPAASSRKRTTCILRHMRRQAQLAIDTADVILFGDGHPQPASPRRIRTSRPCCMRSGKPVFLVRKQVQTAWASRPLEFYDFYNRWASANRIRFPRCTATAPATCWTRCATCLPEHDRWRRMRTSASVWRSSAGPTWASPRLVNHIAGRGTHDRRQRGGHHPRRDRHVMWTTEYGKFTFHRHRRPRRKRGKVEDGVERYSVLRSLDGRGARRGVRHHDRRHRGLHRAGFQGGGLRPRAGQGVHHRREQVGRGGERRQDHGRRCAKSWRTISASCPTRPSSSSRPKPASGWTSCSS